MLIGDKYRVESDRMNITLYEKSKPKEEPLEGDEESPIGWRPLGYFATFQGLLTFLVDHDIKGLGLDNLTLIIKRQAELYLTIMSLDVGALSRGKKGHRKAEEL